MKKTLYDLTKEEWNTLFPIQLVDHNPAWKGVFMQEKQLILDTISTEAILQIEHFGSTSIPTIKSKPYIDIIIETPEELLFDDTIIKQFKKIGYTYFLVPKRELFDAYMSFGKGYKLDGTKEQIFHIHMCPKNNLMWEQVKFRDYLISHPKRAMEYEKLKIKLAAKHKNDRGGYVLSKTNFINETLELIENTSTSSV
ncbi:GrpB family protein [Aquimarina sp. BL5]|uniref:GrpB family protein n=1 Tax=Aquimarina sp. BL5 TaxID=1714860 RepID=UPI000E51EC21|nr:GrpB family protein [Aquimarina sp. BL5]AXT53901.1 GrpB family protein [Aquimarina sp. BL5]RKN00293.1 GrpB family protein [Aquimarina sp. BL5]